MYTEISDGDGCPPSRTHPKIRGSLWPVCTSSFAIDASAFPYSFSKHRIKPGLWIQRWLTIVSEDAPKEFSLQLVWHAQRSHAIQACASYALAVIAGRLLTRTKSPQLSSISHV